MQKFLLAALAAGTALVAISPAQAAEGCGRGLHRGPNGGCHPNYGGYGRPYAGPRGPYVVDRYYAGRGYWNGSRWYWHRRSYNHGWQYY